MKTNNKLGLIAIEQVLDMYDKKGYHVIETSSGKSDERGVKEIKIKLKRKK